MKFTDANIKHLKPRAQRYEEWDGNGFGVRVTPRGVKSFVWMYRYGGRSRRLTLGSYPSMSLADVNIALGEARKLLAGGDDPGEALVAGRKAEREAETVAELVDEYLKRGAPNRSHREYRRILDKDVAPNWGTRKAKDIRKRDIVNLLDRVVDRGAPIQANRTFAVVRRMFNWAVAKDIIQVSPCTGVETPSGENARDRVLSTKEIRTFWNNLDAGKMSEATRIALRLQLVTAQRKSEVVGAAIAEFDVEDEQLWTIPPERSKNSRAHQVPLSPLAVDLVRQAIELAGEVPWLFPSPRGEKPVTPESVDHALRNNRDKLVVYDVTPHDLRRTAATRMTGDLGISRFVVSRVLNHADSGVTSVYDRHSYLLEKRHALEAWGRRLEEILGLETDDNVASLERARSQWQSLHD